MLETAFLVKILRGQNYFVLGVKISKSTFNSASCKPDNCVNAFIVNCLCVSVYAFTAVSALAFLRLDVCHIFKMWHTFSPDFRQFIVKNDFFTEGVSF